MDTVGKRLRYLREKLGNEGRKKFVKGLKISDGTLENYENDQSSPTAEFIEALFAKYQNELTIDDINWLITGERYEGLPSGDYARVPLYDVQASAGAGAVVAGEEVLDVLAFKKSWLSHGQNRGSNPRRITRVKQP